MMQLPCPHCGLRDEHEFRFGGPAHTVRPGPPELVNDDSWTEYLFHHDQIAGWQAELWVHQFGCRKWFNLWRNTVTHEVGPAALIGEKMAQEPEP